MPRQPNTKELIRGIVDDLMPGFATCVDFGIDMVPQAFGALQWAYKHELTTDHELDEALGNGPKLTEIVNRKDIARGQSNPYACTIKTVWDEMPTEEDAEEWDEIL